MDEIFTMENFIISDQLASLHTLLANKIYRKCSTLIQHFPHITYKEIERNT